MSRPIPLYRKGKVVAEAIVDDEDFGWLNEHRWRVDVYGYAVRFGTADHRTVYMAREILGLERGDPLTSDHINCNRLDNRRSNLRPATRAEQMQNRKGYGKTSRYRGVYWDSHRRKWQVRVTLNYVVHFIGRFDDEEEAGRAAAAFRRVHMPFSQADAA